MWASTLFDEVLDWHQVGTSREGPTVQTDRFTLFRPLPLGPLEGAAFYAAYPARVVRQLRAFDPDVVIVQGAHDTALALLARRIARVSAPVVFDVHGDWRNDTRVYGSPLRRLASPLTDRLARHAVRGADGVRTVSAFTSGLVRELGVEPTATFPAYMDLAEFTAPPVELPMRPTALFIGVLERYKGLDVLARAWPAVARELPDAALHLVGKGSLAPLAGDLVEGGEGRVRWSPELSTAQVAAALDEATVLVLPSRREGMGRVIVEAFCRGRAVVGTAAGGILDLVVQGESGLLVPVGDAPALAAALIRVLGEPELARSLGAGAHEASAGWLATPEDFARRVRELVDLVLAAR